MPGFPHTVIRASAGTGKTFQLSNRFLGLVACGESPDAMLATTFARKAAGEILDRVLLRLAEGVGDADKCAALAEQLGIPGLDRPTCAALLQTLIRRLHRLRIGTLDAYFLQLAASVGLELGLPPGWRICDELEDERLRWEAIQEVLRNEETNAVVNLMHLLGKGEIRRSIADQMLSVVRELYGLFLETEEPAWRKLVRRRELTADELTLAVGVMESFEGLPVHETIRKGHLSAIDKLRKENWAGFLEVGIPAKLLAGEEDYCRKPISQETIDVYRPVIEHALAVLVNRIVMQTEASRQLLSRFHEVYRRLKRERRAMRFEDVTHELSRGLGAVAAHDVAFRMDGSVSHLLLDEFQDTSLPQWSVLRPSAERITAARGGAADSFFCVGDVKQAIYGWRGGVSAVFEAVTERLANLTLVPLNESFRSSPPVIEAVNAVFSRINDAAPLDDCPLVRELWGRRFQLHSTARTELPGYCRMITAPRVREGQQQLSKTLSYTAEMIADLSRRSPGRSIGVLVRRNEVVARLSYELREKQGIAASEEGGNPLTDSTGVQVVLSAVTLADHPGDLAARFHLAHSPLAPILGLLDWNDPIAALRASRAVREALLRDGYGRTVWSWVRMMAAAFDERELKRMLQLVELAYRYESQATVRGDDFAEFVRQTKVEDPTSAPVRVMTIHQAKGLEFDIVVLPELEGRLVGSPPPVLSGRDDPLGPVTRVIRYAGDPVKSLLPREFRDLYEDQETDRINESLCVLYVAMTRAIHELHLVIAPASEKESKIPATYAGILRSTLCESADAGPERVLFECGDPEWRTMLESPRGVAGADRREPPAERAIDVETAAIGESAGGSLRSTPATPAPLAPLLAPTRGRRARGLRRTSPSGREGGGYVNLERMLRLESSVAMARGTLIHKWFEQVEWLDGGTPADGVLKQAAVGLVPPELSLERELTGFRAMLKRPAIRAALSRSSYAVHAPAHDSLPATAGAVPREVFAGVASGQIALRVEPERTFAFRTETELVPGSIDRLVTFLSDGRPVAAEILDFKTDAVGEPGALETAVEHYRPQMEAYRQAVARITGVPTNRVAVRLLFVGEGIARSL